MSAEQPKRLSLDITEVKDVSNRVSDVFAAWAAHIDMIEDDTEKAIQDTFFNDLVKMTMIMEIDLSWARSIFDAAKGATLHPGLKTQVEGFLRAYERKYHALEDV